MDLKALSETGRMQSNATIIMPDRYIQRTPNVVFQHWRSARGTLVSVNLRTPQRDDEFLSRSREILDPIEEWSLSLEIRDFFFGGK